MYNVMENPKTIGLETFKKRLVSETYKRFKYQINNDDSSFTIYESLNEKYVQPFLSIIPEYSSIVDINDASIILISAVGATGKTELTKFLSASIGCPVVDLAKINVVASNSITGLFFKKMQKYDMAEYLSDIAKGSASFIIDALDEGMMKTNISGYYDFLDDVISFNPNAKSPLVLLGRSNSMELTSAFLFDKGINVVTLQIEPFTRQKAIDFLDNYVKNESSTRYDLSYRQTRDFIIDKIGGFFKDQADIKNHQFDRFIGYAPVLQSIAAFFDENSNYYQILTELKDKDYRNIQLIVNIIERILKRDREEKVFPNLVNSLIKDRDAEFIEKVTKEVYSDEEQCARLLYLVLRKDFSGVSVDDPSFQLAYNQGIKTWIQEHPFLMRGKFANVVFESYILAKLILCQKYQNDVIEYIHKNKDVSYMFFYIFDILNKSKVIDNKIIPFLYSSICELNTSRSSYGLEMGAGKTNDGKVECFIRFASTTNDNLQSYCYIANYPNNAMIDLGRSIYNVNVDIPFDFVISQPTVHCFAPSYIKCETLNIYSSEMVLHRESDNSEFIIECNNHNVVAQGDSYLSISNQSKEKNIFQFCSSQRPDYPLYEYWRKVNNIKENVDELKYSKLRRIVLFFRSHSKGEFARHHELIDFVLGNTPVGQAVIKALVDSGIMYRDEHLYKLRTDIMNEKLGLSYDGFRNFDLPQKLLDFLNSIKVIS